MNTTTLTQPGLVATTPTRNGRVSFARVLRMEWIKLWSLSSTIYTLAITVALVIGFGALTTAVIGSGDGSPAGPPGSPFGDPTAISLGGVALAALAMAVLGVLTITGEYATGTIRATFTAVPRRLPVLWAKVAVFTAVSLVAMLIAVFAADLIGQAILASRGLETAALGDPGVLRAVIGAAVYLTGAGLIGMGIGALLRNTAGSITSVVALLFVVPGLIQLLPQSWNETISPYLPSNAAGSFMSVQPAAGALDPWVGLAVFAASIVALLAAAAVLLVRRDA